MYVYVYVYVYTYGLYVIIDIIVYDTPPPDLKKKSLGVFNRSFGSCQRTLSTVKSATGNLAVGRCVRCVLRWVVLASFYGHLGVPGRLDGLPLNNFVKFTVRSLKQLRTTGFGTLRILRVLVVWKEKLPHLGSLLWHREGLRAEGEWGRVVRQHHLLQRSASTRRTPEKGIVIEKKSEGHHHQHKHRSHQSERSRSRRREKSKRKSRSATPKPVKGEERSPRPSPREKKRRGESPLAAPVSPGPAPAEPSFEEEESEEEEASRSAIDPPVDPGSAGERSRERHRARPPSHSPPRGEVGRSYSSRSPPTDLWTSPFPTVQACVSQARIAKEEEEEEKEQRKGQEGETEGVVEGSQGRALP